MKIKLEGETIDTNFNTTRNTISFDVDKQIKDKYRTFTKFNERTVLQEMKRSRKKKDVFDSDKNALQLLKHALQMAFGDKLPANSKKISQKQKNKPKQSVEQAGIKSDRRQRYKRYNPFQIINHYMQSEGFKPTEQQKQLITGLIEIKTYTEKHCNNLDIDKVLKKIYKLMNEAVDYNQTRFLCLLIVLSAQICFQEKDFNRSFYFLNEARKFSSYTSYYTIKTNTLISMAEIGMDLKMYEEAMSFLKKALQYAWKSKNVESELKLYDILGTCFYHQGSIKQAEYFHHRFSQGETEKNQSAIKRISNEMIHEYEKNVNSLQRKNLTSLFLEYINIPIGDLTVEGLAPVAEKNKRIYENYNDEGHSPRRNKTNKNFEFPHFPDVVKQIQKILKFDPEFKTAIPNPDVQHSFVPMQRFGRVRKNVAFQQSSDFHKIIGLKPQKLNFDKIHSFSLEQKIEKLMSQRTNTNWWQDMLTKIRNESIQKVGNLKDRVRNSHQSYSKYPQQRRRANSLKNQKIKQSFNATLLDWIDPVK